MDITKAFEMSQLLVNEVYLIRYIPLYAKTKHNVFKRVIFKNVLRFCTDLYASDVFVLRPKKKQDKAWTYVSEQFDCIFLSFAITLCSKTTQL